MLKGLILKDFRNYRDVELTFTEGVNVFCGANAQGKSNLLEAISLLMTGRSFRTTRLSDLIRVGAQAFYIEAYFERNSLTQSLRLYFDGKQRTLRHNRTVYPSFSPLLGLLPGVCFSPDDQALIKGPPALRRRFLDMQISQASPVYVHHLVRYHRALKQRNLLLRAKSVEAIETWEKMLSQSAAQLVLARRRVVKRLNDLSSEIFSDLSQEKRDFSLSYSHSAPEEGDLVEYFTQQYQKQRARELHVGTTLVGPHKDELKIAIDKQETRVYGSEGQGRLCLAAMRFAEWKQLNELGDVEPLFLIDDLAVSLDQHHLNKISSYMQSLGQVFLTMPDLTDEIEASASLVFQVEGGTVNELSCQNTL